MKPVWDEETTQAVDVCKSIWSRAVDPLPSVVNLDKLCQLHGGLK
jgi:hypothetical protein